MASWLRRRLGEEHGQALVLAMAIVMVGMLLGLGAVAYALNASKGTTHDERTRGAQQASDSGIQQQLFLQSSSSSVSYNFSGGVLGTSALLNCVLPPLTITASAGSSGGYINSAGQCVSPSGGNNNGNGGAGTPAWTALGNEDYYQSEFFNTTEAQVPNTGGGGNADYVEFPSIVSLGCHTTTQSTGATSTTATNACAGGGNATTTSNNYVKQLALLQPTAPLSAMEAANDVTINSSSTLLTSATTALVSPLSQLLTNLGLGPTLTGLQNLCSSIVGGVSGLIQAALNLLGINVSGLTNTCSILTNLTNLGGVAIVDGNVSAGHDLYLPSTVIDSNTTANGSTLGLNGTLGALTNTLTSVGGVLSNLSNISGTFKYGASDASSRTGDVCSLAWQGQVPTVSGTNTNCMPQSNASSPVTAIGASFVQATAGKCTAGAPSTSCTVARPTFSVNSGLNINGTVPAATLTSNSSTNSYTTPTSVVAGSTSITYAGAGKASYTNGVISVTGDTSAHPGTLTFASGTYVVCGLYADANTSLVGSSSGGAVQIYVLGPKSAACANASTTNGAPPGNFVACGGSNGLALTNGITNTLNPSSLQIYVVGSGYSASGSPLPTDPDSSGSYDTAVSSCPFAWTMAGSNYSMAYTATQKLDPVTQVYLGSAGSTSSTTQGYIVYAPQSEVTLTSNTAFSGSLIGWNVDVTATAILQDLNLGNYAISSVANAYQVAQTIQCKGQTTQLTGTAPTYSTITPGQLSSTGDLTGC